MKELRANTAVIVPIGPVVSIADGFTPVTTLDISTADSARLLKHNTSTSVDIAARTWAFITAMRNTYALSLTTTDTNTEGCMEVVITDDSLNLTVVKEFMVLSEAAWDMKYGTDAPATAASLTTVDTVVDAIKAVTDNIPNSGALQDLTAAQVNTEVVDALNVDTYVEPTSPPAATASLAAKINWTAALARNKITQTSALQTLRNDADSANIGTCSVSSDGVTFVREEWA